MQTRFRIHHAASGVAIALAMLAQPASAQSAPTRVAPSAGQAAVSPASAALDRHLAAFARHDVDAIMTDYSDHAVFITPHGVRNGKAEIRALFEGLVAEFSAPEAKVTIGTRHASGAVAYVTWSAETPQNRYEFATDTLYVENGLIQYQTFAAVVTPN